MKSEEILSLDDLPTYPNRFKLPCVEKKKMVNAIYQSIRNMIEEDQLQGFDRGFCLDKITHWCSPPTYQIGLYYLYLLGFNRESADKEMKRLLQEAI